MQYKYPKTEVDVAEIDPAVTRANFAALGLPKDTGIKTYWGDARQFVAFAKLMAARRCQCSRPRFASSSICC